MYPNLGVIRASVNGILPGHKKKLHPTEKTHDLHLYTDGQVILYRIERNIKTEIMAICAVI